MLLERAAGYLAACCSCVETMIHDVAALMQAGTPKGVVTSFMHVCCRIMIHCCILQHNCTLAVVQGNCMHFMRISLMASVNDLQAVL